VFSRPSQTLRIAIEDQDCERMANTAYEITIDGKLTQGSTDDSGVIDKNIPVDAENCTLKIGDYRWTIAIGHLHPLFGNTPDSGVSGAQGRLRNLGYPVGPIDGILGPRTQMAIRFFQADESLKITGKLDDETRNKLGKVHGL
jgi:peptidoglycan hydrolase-like protein with peptidoglycan-binding domain